MLGSMKKKAIQYVLRCFERNQRLAAFRSTKQVFDAWHTIAYKRL